MKQDGLNPSCFIVDEFHAAQNYDNYNILKSGQAARKNPLAIIISSAGVLLDTYPCFETA
jgi:phage terminase large subunit-like protein